MRKVRADELSDPDQSGATYWCRAASIKRLQRRP